MKRQDKTNKFYSKFNMKIKEKKERQIKGKFLQILVWFAEHLTQSPFNKLENFGGISLISSVVD